MFKRNNNNNNDNDNNDNDENGNNNKNNNKNEIDIMKRGWYLETTPIYLLSSMYECSKTSKCELEVDGISQNILNQRLLYNIKDIKDAKFEEYKLVPSLDAIWNWEKLRRIKQGLTVTTNMSHIFTQPPKRICSQIPQNRIEKRYYAILDHVVKKYQEMKQEFEIDLDNKHHPQPEEEEKPQQMNDLLFLSPIPKVNSPSRYGDVNSSQVVAIEVTII